jgi:uncharacterized membrane protein (UPF0127 family)
MRQALLTLALLTLATFACRAEPTAANLLALASFPRTTLSIHSSAKTHAFDIWLAETPEQQEQGLMFVRDLPANRGMLFISEQPRVFHMWMKNTFIPLSVAFMGSDGRILNIEDMAPRDESLHWSRAPAQYALEMRKGWFAERGIGPGDRIEGLPPPQ